MKNPLLASRSLEIGGCFLLLLSGAVLVVVGLLSEDPEVGNYFIAGGITLALVALLFPPR